MHISRLALDHYRSWDHCVLDFEPGINILQGSNGLGKTNIVEAVEVLSTGSSHRTSSSLPLVEKGHPSATVRANVEDAGEQRTYEITIAARGANRARVDGGKSQYMRDIVGLVPSVSFTPEDQRLVSGDPATRRNFINQAASLLLPRYAQSLQQFTHVAKQRAALLKRTSDDFTDKRISTIGKKLQLLEVNRQVEQLGKRSNEDLFLKNIEPLRAEVVRLGNLNTDMSKLGIVSIDRKAQTPISPIKPKKALIVGLGLIFGCLLGIGIATGRFLIARRREAL